MKAVNKQSSVLGLVGSESVLEVELGKGTFQVTPTMKRLHMPGEF